MLCIQLAYSTLILPPKHMVRNPTIYELNTKRTVPLDVVPERRTERCSPGFRPSDCFYEVSFRYPSPGIEGEKCRPLDHM